MHRIRIRDIHRLFIRRKAQAIRLADAVRNSAHVARLRIVPIHLARQLRPRADVLLVTVRRVREPDAPVGAHYDVVDRVEPPPVVVADDRLRAVRRRRLHVRQSPGVRERALLAEEHPVAVVDAAVGHLDAWVWVDFLDRELAARSPLDLRDLDFLLPRDLELVARDPDLVMCGDVHARLVRERVRVVFRDDVQLGRRA